MFNLVRLNKTEDYFKSCSERAGGGVYFCRLCSYGSQAEQFLRRFLEETQKSGVYIKGKIPNPNEKQLAFFEEMIGLEFRMEKAFLSGVLKKWLPRLDNCQRTSVQDAMYAILFEMSEKGKNMNMLKNAYIKFMCWFYYKFERILNQLGRDRLPKILYEGEVSDYELKVLRILSGAGCDILLLQCKGDAEYHRLDKESRYSQLLKLADEKNFPKDFTVLQLLSGKTVNAPEKIDRGRTGAGESSGVKNNAAGNRSQNQTMLSGSGNAGPPSVRERPLQSLFPAPDGIVSTNTWITGEVFAESLKEARERGKEPLYYYNMFIKLLGAEDKAAYFRELLRWKLKLESQNRVFLVIERMIPAPFETEIQKVGRENYQTMRQMLSDLSNRILFPRCRELEKLTKKAFIELLEEESKKPGKTLQMLRNRAVCLLCWIFRYLPQLFTDWKIRSLPVFVYYGMCRTENEAMLLRLFSRLPIDVFLICPDLELKDKLEDVFLFEKRYENSLPLGEFPVNPDDIRFGTVAFHAEQELDSILYQETGIYRKRQFKKAVILPLQTTYEEIGILWKEEAKYRPDFEVLDDKVMLPVICSKISGVPDGNLDAYWHQVAKMAEEDTFLISGLPSIKSTDPNPMKQYAASFLKNGKLLKEKIKKHPAYAYGFIREEMQEYMFEKLQYLIDKKLIFGTFSSGTEFTIVAAVLNLQIQLLRLIQKFDFTGKVPKLIILNVKEELCSLEDSIITAYLSLIGFDIAVFSPAGYQSVERYFTEPLLLEHQVGEYLYDLSIPDLRRLSVKRESLRDKLFRRK